MKNFILKHCTKKNIILALILLAVLGGVYYKYYYKPVVTTYEYVKVVRKDLQKTVEGSGTVVSLSELTIQQLQNGGKVMSVNVRPGDFVKKGQIIARLDSRQAAIQVQQARANYDKLINGATSQTTDITKQNLLNAQNSYEVIKRQQDLNVATAKRNLLNSSVTPIAQLDTRFIPNNPSVSGSYSCDEENEYKINMQTSSFANVTDLSGNSYTVQYSSVPQPLGNCGLYLSFDVSKTYAGGEWKILLPNKTAATYVTNLNSYNSALVAREQALLNASTSVTTALLNLNQQIAPARKEDVAASEASLASANLAYENTIVRAPFDGQIGNVSAIVGQQTNSQLGIATIITKTKLAQISLNEVDVTNVKLGQDVKLNFDAIPGETFKGKIYQMDAVGVAVSNVVSFGVKISVESEDARIKSGMSVTANIIVEEKKNILSLPSGAIKTQKEKSYVTRKDLQKVFVQIGITNDIDTEILENVDENNSNNLKEGDEVISKTISSGIAAKPAAATFSLFGNQRPGGTGGGGARTSGATGR